MTMPLWFAALMGLVQGLTEFLPISSTAHLRIVPALLGRDDPGAAFTAVIQLGSLAAVLAYFAKDLLGMARAIVTDRRSPEARLAFQIAAGTIPIGLAGVSLERFITGDARSLWVVATALVAVAFVMWAADRAARQQKGLLSLKMGDALLIGVAQACALVPGVSRSGATLAVALLIGMRRDDAARFSFLLAIPAIAAAGIFELRDAAMDTATAPLLCGTAVAAVASYASIVWLLRFLRTRTLVGFAVYRVALGALLAALLAAGVLSPMN